MNNEKQTICWRCKQPLMEKITDNEIGNDFEIFRYRAIDGKIKTYYCCLVCQMKIAN